MSCAFRLQLDEREKRKPINVLSKCELPCFVSQPDMNGDDSTSAGTLLSFIDRLVRLCF
jgi:hypothetical protein